MKTRSLLFAALSASALLFLSAPVRATTIELFSETFPNYTRGWAATTRLVDQATSETAVPNTQKSGWTAIGTVFEVGKSIRLGNSSADGVLYSPTITLSDNGVAGTAIVRFHAARTANIGTGNSVSVTIVDSDLNPVAGMETYTPTLLVDVNTMGDSDLANCSTNTTGVSISHEFSGLPSSFRLKFSPTGTKGNARVAVGNVLVFQNLPVLSAPANLDLSGDADENEFTVAWDSVANASGYTAKLMDETGAVVLQTVSCTAEETSATFSGLVSSTDYLVSVVALGDGETYDDSVAATLPVTTAASAIPTPMLSIAETSWSAGVAGTSTISAILAGNIACTIESVTMSDNSAATVENGILSWTPAAASTALSVTATFHVTHDSNEWDIEHVFIVAATPAPGAPSITLLNTTAKSFDASWSSAGGPVVEYKVRAWTGRATPDDATGSASEDFADYLATTNVPSGWTFMTTKQPYNQAANPVDFRNNNEWVATPDYGGTITAFSFRLRRQSESGSTFTVYGSSGSADPAVWKTEANKIAEYTPLVTQVYNVSVEASRGVSRLFFQYTKASGNVSIGTFSVSGTDWPAADFLEGWGGAKVSVGTATSQTFSNPVPGTANYVEVTAIGPTGLTATTIDSVPVPRPSTVISVW